MYIYITQTGMNNESNVHFIQNNPLTFVTGFHPYF